MNFLCTGVVADTGDGHGSCAFLYVIAVGECVVSFFFQCCGTDLDNGALCLLAAVVSLVDNPGHFGIFDGGRIDGEVKRFCASVVAHAGDGHRSCAGICVIAAGDCVICLVHESCGTDLDNGCLCLLAAVICLVDNTCHFGALDGCRIDGELCRRRASGIVALAGDGHCGLAGINVAAVGDCVISVLCKCCGTYLNNKILCLRTAVISLVDNTCYFGVFD